MLLSFASKALHLEAVSDLATNTFPACIQRFIARRGVRQRVYCDNDINFAGAAAKMEELKRKTLHQDSLHIISS